MTHASGNMAGFPEKLDGDAWRARRICACAECGCALVPPLGKKVCQACEKGEHRSPTIRPREGWTPPPTDPVEAPSASDAVDPVGSTTYILHPFKEREKGESREEEKGVRA